MNDITRSRHPINLDPVFAALRRPLPLIADRLSEDAAEAFVAAVRANQERSIADLLSEVTAAVNAGGFDGRLHLEYESGRLILVIEQSAEGDAETLAQAGGDPDKVTLRMPSPLKQAIDVAATSRGVSLNTWCVWTLARAISRQLRRESFPREDRQGRRRGRRGNRRAGSRGIAPPDVSLEGNQDYA